MSRHWRRRGSPPDMRLEVHPHPTGPWVVQAGRRALAVTPEAGRALLPLHGARIGPGPYRPRRSPREPGWRLVIAPVAVVRPLARALAPLTATTGLVLLAAAGLATVACLRPWEQAGGVTGRALILFAAGAVFHELGHAAALRREGYRPGPIGLGLLVFVPVLFADVSAASLLGRGGRVRVDLAGPAFQAGAAGALAVVAATSGPLAAPAGAACLASLTALAWSLLPLPRSDGGWALRDALDHARPGIPSAALTALAAARLALAALACVLLPSRVAALLAAAAAGAGRPLSPSLRLALHLALQAAAAAWAAAALARSMRRRRAGRSRGGAREPTG